MYLQFYQLRRAPFQAGDEAVFFWKGEQYRQALSVLRQVSQKGGVSLLTGDVGTGKTAVAHALLREMGKRAVSCLISDPDLTVADFYQMVLHGFRIHRSVDTREAFQDHLGRLLHKAARRRRSVLLVIDEAQHLPPELADEVAATAASCGTAAGLHICLVGQTAAGRKALLPVIGPLDRHITADFHIFPLDDKETAAYVRYRLETAGAGQEIFTDEALQEVYRQSDGIPIQINLICDFALFSGFAERTPVITDDIVRWSADGLRLPEAPAEEPLDAESPEEDVFTEDAVPQTTEAPAGQEAAFAGDDEERGPVPAARTDLPGEPVRRSRFKPALAAAAVLVLLSSGGYVLVAKPGGVSLPALLKRFTPRVSATPEAPAVASQSAAPPMPVVSPAPPAPAPKAAKTPPAVAETGHTASASAGAAEDAAPPSLSGRPTGIIEEDLTDETQTARPQEFSPRVRAAVKAPAEPDAQPEAPPPAGEKTAPHTVRPQVPAQMTETPAAFAPAPLAAKTASTPRPAEAKIPAPPTETEAKTAATSETTALVGDTAPPAESGPAPTPSPAAAPAEAPAPPGKSPAQKASPLPPAAAQAPPPVNPQPPAQSAVMPGEAEKAPAPAAPAAAPVIDKPAPSSSVPPTQTAQAEPKRKHGIPASSLLADILKDGAFFESSPQSSAPREETAAPPAKKKAEPSVPAAPQRTSGEPDPSAVINWLLKKKGK